MSATSVGPRGTRSARTPSDVQFGDVDAAFTDWIDANVLREEVVVEPLREIRRRSPSELARRTRRLPVSRSARTRRARSFRTSMRRHPEEGAVVLDASRRQRVT
jgi:hypothetical protein